MEYIELVKRAIRYSGARIDAPSSVSTATGLAADFVDYVNDAYRDIQMERPEWYFRMMPRELEISEQLLDKGQKVKPSDIQAPASPSWNFVALYDIFIKESDKADDQPSSITFIPWNNCHNRWGRSEAQLDTNEALEIKGRPQRFTIAPNGEMWLNPIPDKSYVMHFMGPNKVQKLCDDCDQPYMPEEYHDMIVWRAVRDYAMYQQDAAMMEKARIRYLPLKKSLDAEYLPQITLNVGKFYEHIR